MKNKIKNLIYLTPLFINNVFADEDFFSDYPKTGKIGDLFTGSGTTLSNAVDQGNKLLSFGWEILKWAWAFLTVFTLISVIVCLIRLAIHANDSAFRKDEARHDLMTSFVLLAILGGGPLIFIVITNLLNLAL